MQNCTQIKSVLSVAVISWINVDGTTAIRLSNPISLLDRIPSESIYIENIYPTERKMKIYDDNTASTQTP